MFMDAITEGALALLRRDGRLGFSALARSLGTTRAEVSRRITPLLATGTFRAVAALRPELLGLNAFCALRIRPAGAAPGLARQLCQLPDAVFVSETTGAYRFTVEVHCPDAATLHSRISTLRAWPQVAEVQPLLYQSMLSSFFVDTHTAGALPRLDRHDRALIEALRVDGRATFDELAAASGLSPTAARARTRKLQESGAVRIGLVRGRTDEAGEAVVGFGVIAEGHLEQLTSALKREGRVEFLAQTVGQFDATGTVTLAHASGIPELVDRLHSLAPLRHVETWQHVRIHREAYRANA